jgi:aminoglycoside 3-N-acetyltransferase
MLTIDDFNSALERLELGNKPAIAHASLKSFGLVRGGAETVLEALLASVSGLILPAFTYKTMLTPEVGPPNNGLSYGSQRDLNRMAVPFQHMLTVDPLIGILAETLLHYPGAMRTAHPILSFVGVHVSDALVSQTLYNPFAPIGWLADHAGWVLLLGVNHSVNTSIHYAEKQAGRRQFLRWALTGDRVVECPGFPGCSEGFEAIRPEVEDVTRRVKVGGSFIEAIPIRPLFQAIEMCIKKDPLALLCQRDGCERCDAIRSLSG